MSELETLNMLLRLIGSSPVNSLSTDHPDATNAITTMRRISRKAQRKGWWFNIDYGIDLSPNNRGEIRIGDDISSAVFEDSNLVVRGNRVHDKVGQTAIFSGPVRVTRLVRVLAWDDLPDVMQEYCAYYAASEYVRDELEDPNKEQSLKETAAASLLDLKSQELSEAQYNIFNKPRVARALGGIRPYGRGRKRFAGDPDV